LDSNKVQLIQLPKITDPRGNLSFFKSNMYIPFNIKESLSFSFYNGNK